MTSFLDNEVNYGSIIMIAISDSSNEVYLDRNSRYKKILKSLGAGGKDCPITISIYYLIE